jgi:hypothetical protein
VQQAWRLARAEIRGTATVGEQLRKAG